MKGGMARAGVTVCIAALWYQSEDRNKDSVEGTVASWESLHKTMWGEFSQLGLDRSMCQSLKKKKISSSNTIEFSNFSSSGQLQFRSFQEVKVEPLAFLLTALC